MLTVKKIDFYGQMVLAAGMVLSIPILFFYGFSAGLFLIGCWQLLSALLNTYSFISLGQGKKILLYWKLCLLDIAVLLAGWFIEKISGHGVTQIICGTAIIGSIFIAAYYLHIYNRHISLLSLRNELDGLTKSKH